MVPKLRFSFKNGNLWYWVNGDTVLTSSAPKYFMSEGESVSPKDWAELQFGVSRNERLHGVFRTFSLPISCTYDAQKIIKHVIAEHGTNGVIEVIVESADNHSKAYREIIRGEIDLSTIESIDSVEEFVTRVSIAESGAVEDLINKEDQEVEIDMDQDSFTGYIDGVSVEGQLEWVVKDLYQVDFWPPNVVSIPLGVIAGAEGILVNTVFANPQDMQVGPHSNAKNWPHFLKTKVELNTVISGKGSIFVNSNRTSPMNIDIALVRVNPSNGSSTILKSLWYRTLNSGTYGQAEDFDVEFSVNQTFNIDDHFYLVIEARNAAAVSPVSIVVKSLEVKLEFPFRLEPSEAKMMQYPTFVDKVFKKVTGVGAKFLNDQNLFYLVQWICVTSGLALRRVEGAGIKTSLGEVMQDLNRMGFGVAYHDGSFTIINKAFFYIPESLGSQDPFFLRGHNFGSVSDFTMTSYNDILFNEVQTGYRPKTFDEASGRYDFFSTSRFSFPLKRHKGVLDLVSPYSASIYAIEYARSPRSVTYDSLYDNDIYLLDMDPGNRHQGMPVVYRDNSPVTGVAVDPETTYNWRLSPTKSIFYNSWAIQSAGYGVNGESIKFLSSDKYSDVGKGGVFENGDFQISLLPYYGPFLGVPATIQPFVFEFQAYVPEELILDMMKNPWLMYGAHSFIHPNGTKLYFNILDMASIPATKGLYTVRGVSTVDNNLKKLVPDGNN